MVVVIPGQPVGKGRPRFARVGGFVRTYTPKKTRDWEKAAAEFMAAAHSQTQLVGPVRVRVNAVGARPKRLMRKKYPEGRLWRATKPDGDNVLKCVADSMVMAGVISDDVQIVDQRVRSLYAAKNEQPCVEVSWVRISEPIHDAPTGEQS